MRRSQTQVFLESIYFCILFVQDHSLRRILFINITDHILCIFQTHSHFCILLAPPRRFVTICRPSPLHSLQMYYDPYAPRIGPTAMPLPRSKIVPYFAGRFGTFEDFLEEFEDHAHACKLTDSQQVDAPIRYMDLCTHEFCKTLDGFRACREWTLFRHSLVKVAFHGIIPPHQIKRKKLDHLVEDRSRSRMGLRFAKPTCYSTTVNPLIARYFGPEFSSSTLPPTRHPIRRHFRFRANSVCLHGTPFVLVTGARD